MHSLFIQILQKHISPLGIKNIFIALSHFPECVVNTRMHREIAAIVASALCNVLFRGLKFPSHILFVTCTAASPLNMSLEEKMEVDNRSIYVGNVDYGATAEELEQHFHGCGSINRVTILCNKFDGHPKGFAYIEFGDRDSVQTAMAMDESLFRGRQIKVFL